MDAMRFGEACLKKSPHEMFEEALEVFKSEIPKQFNEHYDLNLIVQEIADFLFSTKQFIKAEKLLSVLRDHQPEAFHANIFLLIPDLIYYHLYRKEPDKVAIYMYILAESVDDNFESFLNILDILTYFGYVELIDELVTKILKNKEGESTRENSILQAYAIGSLPFTDDAELIDIREQFIEYVDNHCICRSAAETIADELITYFETGDHESLSDKLKIDIPSFRNFIFELTENDFSDTAESGAAVLWGAVYLYDLLDIKGIISKEECDNNRKILSDLKAFLLVNIAWDSYWRLSFVHNWIKPISVSEEEFKAESEIFDLNLKLTDDQIIDANIDTVFGQNIIHLSYGPCLQREQDIFESETDEMDHAFFGSNNKNDSVFPMLNYLSGEQESEILPSEVEPCACDDGTYKTDCCGSPAEHAQKETPCGDKNTNVC